MGASIAEATNEVYTTISHSGGALFGISHSGGSLFNTKYDPGDYSPSATSGEAFLRDVASTSGGRYYPVP